MKKGREKRGKEEKKKRVIKHTLKYLYKALMTAKKSTKTRKNFRGVGGIFLAGQNIYPCLLSQYLDFLQLSFDPILPKAIPF